MLIIMGCRSDFLIFYMLCIFFKFSTKRKHVFYNAKSYSTALKKKIIPEE